jgi:hypothetical protein
MQMQKVDRPKADKKKIHCKNEFELCYLRHQYLRKVDFNPSEEQMRPYFGIVSNLAKNTFFTYRNLFGTVGLESEDLISIGQVHLVSFLGLFSVEKFTDEKLEAFIKSYEVKYRRHIEEEGVLDKNKANFTLFLKQRFEDVVRICRQKVRNIKGYPTDDHYVFYGPKKPPKMLTDLLVDHEKYGFKKMDIAVFKTIRKKAGARGANFFKFNDNYYVSVKHEHRNLDLVDFSGAGLDPYDSIHNMSPERIFFDQEDIIFWENKRVEFDSYPVSRRVKLIKSFISKYKNKKDYKDEIKTARKLLKSMEAQL